MKTLKDLRKLEVQRGFDITANPDECGIWYKETDLREAAIEWIKDDLKEIREKLPDFNLVWDRDKIEMKMDKDNSTSPLAISNITFRMGSMYRTIQFFNITEEDLK